MIFSTGKKEYTFQSDSFVMLLPELEAIGRRNHDETGIYFDLNFNVDFDRYAGLEIQGDLAFMIAKYKQAIVGYSIFFLDSEILQKDIKSAHQSMTFIDKGHRGIGYAFIKFCDDILKKRGINSVWRQASAKFDVSPVYERLGYEFIEKSYLRRF